MNINILVEASHTLGKDRGFWQEEKDLREEILYISSNLGDIAKAFKKNKRADWLKYQSMMIQLDEESESTVEFTEGSKKIFKACIKDTFEDEIANVILRITDLLGGKKIDLLKVYPWLEPLSTTELNYFFRTAKPTEEFKGQVPHWLNEALALCMFASDKDIDFGLSHILFHLGSIIEYYDIDIEKHLVKKIEYNRLRPMLYKSAK